MNVIKNSAILIFWFYFDFVLCANTGNLAKVWPSITLLRKVEHFRNRNIAAKNDTSFHKKLTKKFSLVSRKHNNKEKRKEKLLSSTENGTKSKTVIQHIREYARQLRWNGDKRETFSGRNVKASTEPPLTSGTRAAKPL